MRNGVGSILVFMLVFSSSIIPISSIVVSKTVSHPYMKGNVFFVGGLGPNNYTSIQEAVDAASDGDTVFVYDDSSPYNENVVVDKSLALIGEEKQTTVIYGIGINNASVCLQADGASVQGFTLTHNFHGVYIESNDCVIENNIITGTREGISIFKADHTRIEGNMIVNNTQGVYAAFAKDTVISGNIISQNVHHGINLGSENTFITLNTISDNGDNGVMIGWNNNTVLQNTIINNGRYGVDIWNSHNNSILKNNIYDNKQGNVRIEVDLWVALLLRPFQHTVEANYWGRPTQIPKMILGCKYLFVPTLTLQALMHILLQKRPTDPVNASIFIPVLKFDWHPAQEPYDVPGLC